MAVMLAAVHKLIDEMTKKNTPPLQPVSQASVETTPSQLKNGSLVPLSSSVREKSPHPTEILTVVPRKRKKHTATKKFTKKVLLCLKKQKQDTQI